MTLSLALIRHGITVGSSDRRYLGLSSNPSLSERGKREIADRKVHSVYPKADVLYTSPYNCCIETAPLIYPMLVPVSLDFFAERNYGSFAGKNYDQLKNDPDYRRFLDSKGMISPPGGENEQEFSERLSAGLHYIVTSAEKRNINKVAVITHDDCIMNLLMQFYPAAGKELSLIDFQLKNNGGFQVEIDTHSFSFNMVNSL